LKLTYLLVRIVAAGYDGKHAEYARVVQYLK